MATHRVYFGKGAQTLTTIPHRAGSPLRVASGTYSILDTRYGVDSDEHEVVAAGTAATVDATSTTLTARAGRVAADRRAITLTSTTGVTAGHQYIVTNPAGAVELVRIDAVVSATVLRTATEVRGDFATGSTFKGIEVTGTFPADPAAGGKARGAVEVAAEAVGVGHGSGLQLFGVSEGFGGERRH